MRDNFTQIPSYGELRDILARETERPVPHSKSGAHFSDFSVLLQLLDAVGIKGDLFTKSYSLEDLDNPELFEKASKLIQNIISRISEIPVEYLNAVYDYLAQEDTLRRADYIFVFGAKTDLRMRKAIELWKNGYAPKILISGSGPAYGAAQESEAEIHKRYALESGVPEDRIIIESEAITLPDNVKRSLNLLDNLGEQNLTLMLVNSPYCQRRGWAHFMKWSEGHEFIRINSDTKQEYSKDSWYTNEEGIKVILNEYIKLKVAEILNTV